MPHRDHPSGADGLDDAPVRSPSASASTAAAPATANVEQTQAVRERVEAEIAALRGIPADNPFHACVGLFLSAAA